MNVRVDLQEAIRDGMEVVFKAPCDASVVTGLNVYYPVDGVVESRAFTFADANTNDVGHLDALFAEGAVVKVILDLDTDMAFVQNADTNAYLEHRLSTLEGMIGTGGTSDSAKYNSIEDALNDKNRVANGKVTTHIVGDAINIILLDNIASASTINITKDCTLHLNGKKLSFTASGAYLNINTASAVTINGEVAGSEITKNISNGTNEKLVASTGTALNLVGGTYSMYGTYSGNANVIFAEGSATKANLTGCNVIANVSAPSFIYGIMFDGSCTIDNCTFDVTTQNAQWCIAIATAYSTSDNISVQMNDSTVTVKSSCPNSYVYGIDVGAAASIENCAISCISSGLKSNTLGIYIGNTVYATINNCDIKTDGNGDADGAVYLASAISSIKGSTLTVNGGYYFGTREALSLIGTARINGGIYEGCQHGGCYMQGADIKVKNATFSNIEYTGDCGWDDSHFGAVYCGGSSGNANVSFDNCRFESEVSTSHAVTAKYTNTKVYLSNSIIDGIFGDDLRADESCVIYVGKNVFYNASKVTDNIDATTYANQEFGFETEPTDCENLIEIKTSLLGGKVEQLGQAVKGKSYELIDTITFEEAAALDLTQEPDGTPYKFDRVMLLADIPAEGEGSVAEINARFPATSDRVLIVNWGALTSKGAYYGEIWEQNGYWRSKWAQNTNFYVWSESLQGYNRIMRYPRNDKYRYISGLQSNGMFRAGSVLKIYAVRYEGV